MSSSALHVWAVVLLSTDMRNLVVNRFRHRSDAEECLRLLRRTRVDRSYTIMYAPPEEGLERIMRAIPPNWSMYDIKGDEEVSQMMHEIYTALSHQPLPKVRSLLQTKLQSIAKNHPEVHDIEVRSTIAGRLTTWACQIHELPEISVLSPDYWNL